MNVLVIGASGFVGRHLAAALLDAAHRVRCLARNPAKVTDLQAAGSVIAQGDISDAQSLSAALTGMDAVYISIHTLSAQHSNTSGQGFMEVELNGLKNIVSACRVTGTSRLVYITALGTSPDAKAVWLKERWKAEQFLLHSGLDVTILRPGQIVGKGGQGFDMMVANAQRSRALDLFGNGQQKMQNIAIDDLIYYLVGVLQDERTFGQAYDVGTDEVLTNSQMLDVAADVLGRSHPRKTQLPRGLVSLLAPVIERGAKLPRGAVKALLECAETPMTGDCRRIRAILPRELKPYRSAVRAAMEAERHDLARQS